MPLTNPLIRSIIMWYFGDKNIAILAVRDDSLQHAIAYVYDFSLAISDLKGSSLFNVRAFDAESFMCFSNEEECKLSVRCIDLAVELSSMQCDQIYAKDEGLSDLAKHGIASNYFLKIPKSNNQLPIPAHIKEVFRAAKGSNSELEVSGEIICSCGKDRFIVTVFRDDGNIDGSYLSAQCSECNKEFLIFDSNIHGWDGFVCKLQIERDENEKPALWKCEKCGGNGFRLHLKLSSRGKQDFVDSTKDEIANGVFNEDDWVNAFDWIIIDITCAHCGYHTSGFIDCETA